MITLQAWTNCAPDVEQMLTDIDQKSHPIFQEYRFFLRKKEKILDMQIFSQIGKAMKKLQLIPNTIVNTSVVAIL